MTDFRIKMDLFRKIPANPQLYKFKRPVGYAKGKDKQPHYRRACTNCLSSGSTSWPNHSFFFCHILLRGEGCGKGRYLGRYCRKFLTVSVSVGRAARPK